MPQKLSPEEFDERLVGRPIVRLDELINSSTKIRFQCLVPGCSHIWNTTPNAISRGYGCPACAGNAELSNEAIDSRLKSEQRPITRIGICRGSEVPILFRCDIEECGHQWLTSPHTIRSNKSGCPACAGNVKRTNENIDKELLDSDRKIKRAGDYQSIHIRIEWQCTVITCSHIWTIEPNAILNLGSGCPKCAGLVRLSDDETDRRLLGRDIARLGHYINSATPIDFQCLMCSRIWKATPNHIFAGYGCSKCASGKNERVVGRLLEGAGYHIEKYRRIEYFLDGIKRLLLPDIYLPTLNVFIEYNGRQHYQPVRFGGIKQEEAEANFARQQERDRRLQAHCNDNNIPIIWIDGRTYRDRNLERHIVDVVIPKLKSLEQDTFTRSTTNG